MKKWGNYFVLISPFSSSFIRISIRSLIERFHLQVQKVVHAEPPFLLGNCDCHTCNCIWITTVCFMWAAFEDYRTLHLVQTLGEWWLKRIGWWGHSMFVLKELHLLPVSFQVSFKVLVYTLVSQGPEDSGNIVSHARNSSSNTITRKASEKKIRITNSSHGKALSHVASLLDSFMRSMIWCLSSGASSMSPQGLSGVGGQVPKTPLHSSPPSPMRPSQGCYWTFYLAFQRTAPTVCLLSNYLPLMSYLGPCYTTGPSSLGNVNVFLFRKRCSSLTCPASPWPDVLLEQESVIGRKHLIYLFIIYLSSRIHVGQAFCACPPLWLV